MSKKAYSAPASPEYKSTLPTKRNIGVDSIKLRDTNSRSNLLPGEHNEQCHPRHPLDPINELLPSRSSIKII